MNARNHRRLARSLQVESLESRRMFVVEVAVAGPIVPWFTSFAEVSGLKMEVSQSTATVRTIDTSGTRQVIGEINGTLYSVKDGTIFETSLATGATTTRTLQPLAGSTSVEVRDVGQVNGAIVFVGASLTSSGPLDTRPRATKWSIDGTPQAIGPSGVNGRANFVNSVSGIVGGYYRKSSGEFVPWVHSDLGDFELPGSENALAEQMVTGASATGYYLYGFETNSPMLWQADAAPETGQFSLTISPGSILYPEGAVQTDAGKRFQAIETADNLIYMFGQFEMPVFNQGQIVGYQTHAGMWSSFGDLEYDFGPNTEMLGVVSFGSYMIVAHRNSLSFIDLSGPIAVTNSPLNDLLPASPPSGTTSRILENALLPLGDPAQSLLGINFSETTGAQSQNKLLVLPLKVPNKLEVDAEDDGTYETTFLDSELVHPSFESTGYGTRSLRVRVTYSDNSTTTAVTSYNSVPFTVGPTSEGLNTLKIGGTTGNDSASLVPLENGGYRITIAGQSGDFAVVDSIFARMGSGNDTMVLTGNTTLGLTALDSIETIDLTDEAVQTLEAVDAMSVAFQVGETGTLLIKARPDDVIDLLDGWKAELPQVINGQPTARLTSEGVTLLIQSGQLTNPLEPLDVSFDGFVSALDALLIINYINQSGGGTTPPIDGYLDVNADDFVTALDVLVVINHINTSGAGEGESDIDSQSSAVAVHRSMGTDLATDLELVAKTGKRRTT